MRFDQVKIRAANAASLANFLIRAMDCELLAPVQDFDDPALLRGFGATAGTIRMAWMRLPEVPDGGPILELYELEDDSWAFATGQGHLTFQVADVSAAAERVVAEGGSFHGAITEWEAPSGNLATFVLMRDPEGNVIDLWSR